MDNLDLLFGVSSIEALPWHLRKDSDVDSQVML